MNRLLLIITTAIISLCSFQSFAAVDDKTTFPPVNWTSKNTTEEVTINNGSNVPIVVVVSVTAGTAGANIKNCGNTTHINAGSTAICSTADSANPVTISSDSAVNPAGGTYQIKQQ